MKKCIKKRLKKIPALILAAALIFACLPASSFASGSFYTSVSSMTLTQGSSSSFTFGASSAVGAFEISTDGGVSASCSSEKWVDNSSVTIKVTGNTVGTGHVYISVYDGADYDGNDLSGKSYTVTVTVKASTTTQATTTAAATETTTEETTVDPELELLCVSVDDEQMYVVKDLSETELPDGFEIEERVYNTVTVQVMVNGDIVLYILENETGGTGYYTYNEETGAFEALKYTTLSGKFCIFLDIPETLEIPYGYCIVEAEVCGFTVQALALESEQESALSEESEDDEESSSEPETDESEGSEEESGSEESTSEGEVKIKAFFTVGESSESTDEDEEAVSEDEDTETSDEESSSEDETEETQAITSIDQMVASSDGHYYVYCLLGEEKVLCDYDSEDEILQRCAAIAEVEDEETGEDAAEADDSEEENIDINLILLIDVIIACVIIVILIIVLIIVLIVKRRNKKDPEFVEDIDLDEEDIFYGEDEGPGKERTKFDIDGFFKEQIEGNINIKDAPADEEIKGDEDKGKEPLPEEPLPEELPADPTNEADAPKEEGPSAPAEGGADEDLDIEDITELLSEEFDKMLKEKGEL